MASILNSSIKPLGANGHFSGTYEKLGTNIESISVVIKSNVDGEVKIIFADSPSLPAIFTHTYSYDHTQEFHRVVSKKGLYIKVQYTNGAEPQTSFQMKTYFKNDFEVEQTTEGGNDVNVTNEFLSTEVINNITVEGLTFTESGALVVSGGSSGGDASSANQLTQIEKAEATNEKLDTLNSNVATEATLDAIKTELTTNMPTKTIQENTFDETYLIRVQNTPLQHEEAYADILVDGPTMGADSNPPFTYHPTSEGWYYQNSVASGASNLYFYSNSQAKQTQYTISQLMNSYVVVKLANMTATNTLPFLVVYSRPTGSGDHTVWYKSKWVYTIPNTAQLSQIGQEFLLYWGELPSVKIHPNLHRIEATLASTLGPAQQSETLQYLTVNTDSSATINTVKVIYLNCGWSTIGGLVHDITLGYGKEDKTRQITDKIDNLNSTVGSGVFIQLDGTVSGLKLKSTNNDGSADVNIVNDITIDTTEPLQTVGLAKVHNTLNNAFLTVDAEQQLRVAIGSGSTVSISGTVPVSGTFYQETQPVSISGTVPVSGTFYQETQPVSISGTVPVSGTFYQETQPVSIALPIDNHCYGSSDGTTWHHLKTNTNGVLSTNATLETANGTLTSTVNDEVNALDVQVQNIVNANLRTSTGGLLTSTSAGTINSLDVAIKSGSELKTSDYGALTSTLSGTGDSIHALDVAVKNNVSVQNTNASPLITSPRTAVWTQVATNVPSAGPNSQIGSSIDTDGYTNIWAYITFGTVTTGGSIYIEFSPDNITWIRSYYSTYLSTGTNVNGNIAIGSSVPLKYYRFYTDASFFGATVNAYFAMK